MFQSALCCNWISVFTVFVINCALFGSETAAVFFTLLLLTVVLWHRQPRPVREIENEILAPGQVITIGNRGVGKLAPENTLASIRKARACGIEGVTVDLGFTKDGKAVLMHDGTIERTTNGIGKLEDMSFEDVRKLKAISTFLNDTEYQNEKVPTLEEAVFECMKDDIRLFINVQDYNNADRVAMNLKRVFKKFQVYRRAVVCSYYPNIIYKIREVDPRIVCALVYHPHMVSQLENGEQRYQEIWKQWLAPLTDCVVEWVHYSLLWYMCGITFMFVHKSEASRSVIEYWQKKGIKAIVYGADNIQENAYFRELLKVSYVTDVVN